MKHYPQTFSRSFITVLLSSVLFLTNVSVFLDANVYSCARAQEDAGSWIEPPVEPLVDSYAREKARARAFRENLEEERKTWNALAQKLAMQKRANQENANQENENQENENQENENQENENQENENRENATQEDATQENATQENANQENETQEDATQENATQENETQEDATQDNSNVDVVASAQRSRAGYQAFAKKDYLLAKQECEAALSLNPKNSAAKELTAEIAKKLEELNESISVAVRFFESNQEDEAIEQAREIKKSCVNYPDADDVFKKAANIFVAQSWESYGNDDVQDALAKAREALEFVPDDSATLDLIKMCEDDALESFMQKTPGARLTFNYNGVEFAFRYCPAGTYTMGSPSTEKGRKDNEQQRAVNIRTGFWISETETTKEQFWVVWNTPEKKRDIEKAHYPVELYWIDCVRHIRLLNKLNVVPNGWRFAMPTEEQWEYACRAGTTGPTYGFPIADCAQLDNDIHQVAMRKPNKWGIYDMLGNLTEWTGSIGDEEDGEQKDGSYWYSPRAVVRGLQDYYDTYRPAIRKFYNLDYDEGIRVIIVPDRQGDVPL